MKLHFATLILAPLVSGACTRVPTRDASSSRPSLTTNDGSAEVSVTNHDGLRGLIAALKDVDRVELLRWDQHAGATPLTTADQTHLLQLIEIGQLTDTSTVAHPPWPAAFVFHTRSHGTYAVTLVGSSNLRLDAGGDGGHFEGDAARWNDLPPPEMVTVDPDNWLWTYFESRLGPTHEKEYLRQKAPDYLELPQKPR